MGRFVFLLRNRNAVASVGAGIGAGVLGRLAGGAGRRRGAEDGVATPHPSLPRRSQIPLESVSVLRCYELRSTSI